jgi:hypothetical protein
VEVVVCIPFSHTHLIVSPTETLMFEGVKTIPPAVIMRVVLLAFRTGMNKINSTTVNFIVFILNFPLYYNLLCVNIT